MNAREGLSWALGVVRGGHGVARRYFPTQMFELKSCFKWVTRRMENRPDHTGPEQASANIETSSTDHPVSVWISSIKWTCKKGQSYQFTDVYGICIMFSE